MGASATETLVQSGVSSKCMTLASAAHQGGEGKEEALRLGSDRVKPVHGLPPRREKKWQRWFELPEAKLLPKTSSGSAQVLLQSAVQGREQVEAPQPHKCCTVNCCISSAEMHLIGLLCFMLLVPAKEVATLKGKGSAEPALMSSIKLLSCTTLTLPKPALGYRREGKSQEAQPEAWERHSQQ